MFQEQLIFFNKYSVLAIVMLGWLYQSVCLSLQLDSMWIAGSKEKSTIFTSLAPTRDTIQDAQSMFSEWQKLLADENHIYISKYKIWKSTA